VTTRSGMYGFSETVTLWRSFFRYNLRGFREAWGYAKKLKRVRVHLHGSGFSITGVELVEYKQPWCKSMGSVDRRKPNA